MAKGKKPNNGKRPNNGSKPVNRSQMNRRPSGAGVSAPRNTASGQEKIQQRPASSSMNKKRPVSGARQNDPRRTGSVPSRTNSRSQMNVQAKPADLMDPKYSRPLFGDETEAVQGAVVKKEELKSAPKKLSWWKVRQVHRKNKAIQKTKLKAEAEELAAKKEADVPEVFDETRPDVGEARRKHMEKARKRNAIRAAFNAFLCVLILVGMMIISVLYLMDYVAAKPKYAFASQGSIEHTIGATALVVRNESVMTSTHTGELMTQATEGSRVAKGQHLAIVIPSGMESTIVDLQNVEQQIVDRERQLMLEGKGVAAKTVFSEANDEIRPIVTMIRQDSILNNLSNMTSYSSSIRVLMEKRDSNLKDIDFNDEQLTTLRASESALRTQLENRANSIYADAPGIVSYKLDGHEKEITYDLLMEMVDSKCEELISQCNSIITSDLEIKQSEPVLRIVQNDVQYFACLLKDAPMDEFQINSNHVIRIPAEGISIADCTVVRCSVTRDGLLVVFQTVNSVERLLDRRTVNIEIVQTKTTGIRVPVSALSNADYERGIATIYVNESGYARGYSVQIKDYDREYAIIAPLEREDIPSISTIVITNPQTVKEGDKVER